jgi:hypothetical protein
MLIGYENTKWQKIATKQKEAMKSLPRESAILVPQRLSQLAALDHLGQIPCHAPPLHLHLMSKKRTGQANRLGEFVIKLHDGAGIVFRPAGDFVKLKDGMPDVNTVTEIEITLIGNYHGHQ